MPTAPKGDADARGDSALPLNSGQPAGQTVADGPGYIAFRIPEGRGLLTVVAVTMIEVINSGGSLPADLVEQLLIVKL